MERLFISSVQKELAEERRAIRDYVHGDALLRRFFEVFLFEDLPASDRRADAVYLDEVDRCGLYVGLFGDDYGSPNADAKSPTELEFDRATSRNKPRLIFVKGADDKARAPRMTALIRRAGEQLIRRRFTDRAALIPALYASLVDYLAAKELVRMGPFDATACEGATLRDLSSDKVRQFVAVARAERGFPFTQKTPKRAVLEHLNLLMGDRPTHAAVLLFGRTPQRFLLSSIVKCAQFHGTEVQKPIPSYQVYRGTAFELVDQAVDFALSRINRAVGTRELSTRVPVAYEIPPEVVREAVVNAVAHRDYTSNGSVQVMLFSDRLEVWNLGTLPPSLTLAKLRRPHGSVPGNPLLAEPLYLAKYIERMGTGTGDMITRCRSAGLPEPESSLTDGFVVRVRRVPERAFVAVGGDDQGEVATAATGHVTPEVTPEVARLLRACSRPKTRRELQDQLRLKDDDHFRLAYILPALALDLLEMTIPEKPNSRLQKYRLTARGRAWLAAQTR